MTVRAGRAGRRAPRPARLSMRSTLRALITPFGATGCVTLCEIARASLVVILAVRHQREEDCH